MGNWRRVCAKPTPNVIDQRTDVEMLALFHNEIDSLRQQHLE